MNFTIHLVSYTRQAQLGGALEHGIARVATDDGLPTLDDCEQAIPGCVSAEYLGPEPSYLLRYQTGEGVRERRLGSVAVGRVGRVVSALADREEAWGIEVLDEGGSDVTFNFPLFRV